MIPIAILASGRGSNFEAIQKAIEAGKLQATISVVISDSPSGSSIGLGEAAVLSKARSYGIPAISVPFPVNSGTLAERRYQHESQLLEVLQKWSPRFLVLAGYRRVLTSHLIEAYRCDLGYSRLINIHPSLLPAFPGLNSYAQAFRYGVKVAGVTVHLVESEVDSGPICAQETFSISDCQTEAEVEQRGLKIEHRLFPETLSWVLPEKFQFVSRTDGRLCVCPN